MTPTLTFVCSICGEPSVEICVYCTKDACGNHICEKCHRCSDCCECEVRLEDHPHVESSAAHPVEVSAPPEMAEDEAGTLEGEWTPDPVEPAEVKNGVEDATVGGSVVASPTPATPVQLEGETQPPPDAESGDGQTR